MPVWIVDHYDSFSFNVVEWLWQAGFEVHHVYFDDVKGVTEIFEHDFACVFSPGPCSPSDVPQSLQLMRQLLGRVPVLGICLGHQIFGSLLGGVVRQASRPMHGQRRRVVIAQNHAVWNGIGGLGFSAAAYNSLAVKDVGNCLAPFVIARSEFGEIEALSACDYLGIPAVSFQFHPESFLTESGKQLASNWFLLVSAYAQSIRDMKRSPGKAVGLLEPRTLSKRSLFP